MCDKIAKEHDSLDFLGEMQVTYKIETCLFIPISLDK